MNRLFFQVLIFCGVVIAVCEGGGCVKDCGDAMGWVSP